MGHLVDKELRLAPRVFLFGGDRGGRRGPRLVGQQGQGHQLHIVFFLFSLSITTLVIKKNTSPY